MGNYICTKLIESFGYRRTKLKNTYKYMFDSKNIYECLYMCYYSYYVKMIPGAPTGGSDEYFFLKLVGIMKKDTSYVFIDSEYLYKIKKEFEKSHAKKYFIDYKKFAINLSRSLNLWLIKTYYYTAPPYQSRNPTEEEKKRSKGYRSAMNFYRNMHDFYVKEGRCQKIGNDFKEKGVDTLFTMDLLETAYLNKVNNLILVACDTDYVPVIKKIREGYKLKVYLFYYSDLVRNSKFSFSNHIQNSCDQCIILTKEHFEKSQYKK